MKVVVKDANVLFDLANGGILGAWLSLGYETWTTHLVWHEVSDTLQREKVAPYIESEQIKLRDIEASNWAEIYRFAKEIGVSVPDGSVWFVARTEGALLLTGDGRLRSAARVSGVQVRGVLWVLDELVERERLLPKEAAVSLSKIRECGAFLPPDECEKRMSHWKE